MLAHMTEPSPDRPTGARRRVGAAVQRSNVVERRMSKFLREPPSIRLAASVIVSATVVIVILGGVLIRLLDRHEFASVWVGMWFALQTVTTVGYGDVTPKEVWGRIVGAFIMLEGIAFVTIFTAAVTATFVARAQREGGGETAEDAVAAEADLDARLDDIAERLDRVESLLRDRAQD